MVAKAFISPQLSLILFFSFIATFHPPFGQCGQLPFLNFFSLLFGGRVQRRRVELRSHIVARTSLELCMESQPAKSQKSSCPSFHCAEISGRIHSWPPLCFNHIGTSSMAKEKYYRGLRYLWVLCFQVYCLGIHKFPESTISFLLLPIFLLFYVAGISHIHI